MCCPYLSPLRSLQKPSKYQWASESRSREWPPIGTAREARTCRCAVRWPCAGLAEGVSARSSQRALSGSLLVTSESFRKLPDAAGPTLHTTKTNPGITETGFHEHNQLLNKCPKIAKPPTCLRTGGERPLNYLELEDTLTMPYLGPRAPEPHDHRSTDEQRGVPPQRQHTSSLEVHRQLSEGSQPCQSGTLLVITAPVAMGMYMVAPRRPPLPPPHGIPPPPHVVWRRLF